MRQLRDQTRVGERRGVYRYFIGALVQDVFGIRFRLDSAGDAKRDIKYRSDARNPVAINAPSVRACCNVVKDQLISAFFSVAFSQREDVANDPVISELYAFDDDSVLYIKTGNYPFRRNDAISLADISPSSNALPVMAAGTPIPRS